MCKAKVVGKLKFVESVEELASEKDDSGYYICIRCVMPYRKKCILEGVAKLFSEGGNLVCSSCRKRKDFYVMEEYDPNAVPLQDQPMDEEELMAERKLRVTKK